MAVKAYVPDDKSAVVKLQVPLLFAVVLPSALEPPSDTVTVGPGRRRPGRAHCVVGIDHAAADHRRAGGGGAGIHRHIVRARRRAGPRRGRVGGGEGIGAGRQVRRGVAPGAGAARRRGAQRLEPPSDTVTVDPAGAVPVKLTVSLALTMPLLITGRPAGAGAAHRHIERARRGAGPRRRRVGGGEGVGAGRQGGRGVAPGAGAARRRGAERREPPSDTVTVDPAGAVRSGSPTRWHWPRRC